MNSITSGKVKLGFSWIIVLTLLCAFYPTAHTTFAAAAETGLDLTGEVKGKNGQAVANASIFIYTAGPRAGTGYL
jgi:hypothetical protein